MLKKLFATLVMFAAASAFAAVDLNKATRAELEAVKGIGPAAATKLVDERKKGAFKDWNDVIQRMSGIKNAKAAKLSAAGLTVNGASFDASAVAPKKAKAPKAEKAADKKTEAQPAAK